MKSCFTLILVLILVFSVFSVSADSRGYELRPESVALKNEAVSAVSYSSGPSEIEEFYRTTMTGYYDTVIYPEDKSYPSVKRAVKKADKEFRETLTSFCKKFNVEFKIIERTGPDQIDYKERLSYVVSLSGENTAITEVHRLLENKYEDPPKMDYEDLYF